MDLDIFTVPVQDRFMQIYRSAARRYLVFSSYAMNRIPMYKEIENLGSFLLHCLYLDQVTSRKSKDDTGYYLAPGSRLRIPLYRKVSIPNEPWTDDDDDEIGRIALFVVERKPFERIGALVHCVETYLGYFMEADVTSSSMITNCRLLNRHLERYGVADYVQCVSQGCWSQFNDQNRDVHVLEIRYNIPESEIGTWFEGNVFAPRLVLNRRCIVEAQNHLNIWKLICAVVLTALRFEPGRETSYRIRVSGKPLPVGVWLDVGPHAEAPGNVLDVLECMCENPYVEIMNVQDIQYLHHRGSVPQVALHPLTVAASAGESSPISRVFRRTVPESRLFDPSLSLTDEDINGLLSTTDYESILSAVEVGVLTVHIVQKGFVLRPAGNFHVSIAESSSSPMHLRNDATIPLTYLALDDIEIPPLFLRNSRRRPPDEMQEMVEEARQIIHKRWNFVTSGEGEDSLDRNEKFVNTTHHVHEFL